MSVVPARELSEAEAARDWRMLFCGPCAHVRGTFADGVALVAAVGRLRAAHPGARPPDAGDPVGS